MTVIITVTIKEEGNKFSIKTETAGDNHTVIENMVAQDLVEKINNMYGLGEMGEDE